MVTCACDDGRDPLLEQAHERVRELLQATVIFQGVVILLLAVTLMYRRQAQRQLEQQKQMIESMLDSSLQFMGLLATDGRLLHINRTAQTYFASGDSEITHCFFWEMPWWCSSEDEQARLRQGVFLAAAGEEFRCEIIHHQADGRDVVVDISIRPIRESREKVARLLVEGRDVTFRKQAEAQLLSRRQELQEANDYLKTLMGALPDTLMELDASGRIYQFHSPLKAFPEPPADGWTIHDVLPERACRALLEAMSDAEPTGTSQGRQLSLDGAPERRFELSVSRLPDSGGLPIRFVVLAREISRRPN